MKRKSVEFVAEYRHASAAVALLPMCSTVMRRSAPATPHRMSRWRSRSARSSSLNGRPRREDTLLGALSLEQVTWELENATTAPDRGHGDEGAPNLVEGPEGALPVPRPAPFRFVEAGPRDHGAQAPELRFIPDAEACRVHVDAWFGNPATTEPVRIAPNVRISLLSEHLVVDLATEFVFDVLR